MRPIRAALPLLLIAAPALGQQVPAAAGPPGPPLGDGPRALATLAHGADKSPVVPARVAVLPPLDVGALLAEDALRAAAPGAKRGPRVGVLRRVRPLRAPRRLEGAPGVVATDGGALAWTAEVAAPGAAGLRLHVARFDLPAGATLVAYDADEPAEAYGPFSGDDPRDGGEFWLPTVFGERVRVEVRVPRAASRAPLRLEVDRVAFRYVESPPVGPGKGGCYQDVVCDAAYDAAVAPAVALMETTTFEGVFLCTGTLLNDSDPGTATPWLLTAHHCVSTGGEAANTEFFFDYKAATCGGPAPSLAGLPRVRGARLEATSADTDVTLLRLDNLPGGRVLCGWTAERQDDGVAVAGVHHPGGTQMRISYGTLIGPNGGFHQVRWHDGVTAPGSSGSALLNPNRQVIGQLYGGYSSCTFPEGIDDYGRFDRSYPLLEPFLGAGQAPGGDAWDPADDVPAGAVVLAARRAGTTHGPHVLTAEDAVDWFAVHLVAGSRCRIFSMGRDDVRATLFADAGSAIQAAADDDSGGSSQFSIDHVAVQTGTHYLRVETALAGDLAEYTLAVSEVDPLQVRAPAAPRKLRASVAGTVATLRWKDRAATETGYLVDASGDGGASWSRVAELPRGATSCVALPGPGEHRYRVGPWNAAGASWREVGVSVPDPAALDASDPGDDLPAGATALAPAQRGATPTHSLSQADAEDWYRIDLVAGHVYVFETTGELDTYGALYETQDAAWPLAQDDDRGAGSNFKLTVWARRTGTHWLSVTPYSEGAVGTYVLAWRRR